MSANHKQLQHSLLNELVSLATAVELVFQRLSPGKRPTAEQADALAVKIGEFATLYSLGEGRDTITVLGVDDLKGVQFVDGGQRMQYSDGRTTLADLAITRSDLKIVFAELGL